MKECWSSCFLVVEHMYAEEEYACVSKLSKMYAMERKKKYKKEGNKEEGENYYMLKML